MTEQHDTVPTEPLEHAPEAAAEEPQTEAPAEAPADAPAEAPIEERPREVFKGIHPELLCTCEECAPDYTELQWFSVDEQRKTKGQVMLFCPRSGRKYFSPAPELNAWLTANTTTKPGRSKKD